MTQIFGIYKINGLPDIYPIRDLYNISSIENLPDRIYQINTSSLYVSSDPVGAKIFIDGIEQIGFQTPAMLTDIPSGHHSIKLIFPGYTDIESSIPLESGRTYNVFLSMGKEQTITSADSSGIMILIAIGLGLLLIRK